ncbi:FtsX-like permease family protein [Halobacillus kuroshimensis]|uniref:FtsX-like permease family protein n=1 Tax=Halobacillus kuroshimensis TaxID=302481 RepID=UPI0004848B6D|nr:FtsX-like permease family protein [Halobacillus kuroshimensis]
MFKLLVHDLRKNLPLFFGTFLAIIVTSCIISACLTLVFSSVAGWDSGKRFEGMDLVVMADQDITVSHKEEDGDVKKESEKSNGRVPLSQEQLSFLQETYDAVPDYTFHVEVEGGNDLKLAGHNFRSMELSDFRLNGSRPAPDQVVVDENFAEKHNLQIGDDLPITTKSESREFQISGIALSEVPGMYDLQNYIFFEDAAAEEKAVGSFSAGITTSSPDDVETSLKKDNYTVLSGADKSEAELPNIADENISLMVIFITMGSVCLVISLFVISGTVQFSIQNRFRTLALLRVIGLKKSQVQMVLAGQALIIGFAASLIGILLGIPLAEWIVKAYQRLGIVQEGFQVTPIWIWEGVVLSGIMVLSLIVTLLTAKRPLSVSPISALKEEGDFTRKTSAAGTITGVILILGGAAILIFTPMSGGIGIGMAFCACSLFLGGIMSLTPLLMKAFNWILSVFFRRLGKSLGQVAYANIKEKASKFAVASVSISIMMTLGTVMMLNNITYMDAVTQQQYDFAKEYSYVTENIAPSEIDGGENILGLTNTETLLHQKDDLLDLNMLVTVGNVPDLNIIEGTSTISGDSILLSNRFKEAQPGDTLSVFLEDGTQKNLTVKGIFQSEGLNDESFNSVTSFETVEESLYDYSLAYVYSDTPLPGSERNNYAYYADAPSYDLQLGASLLLGVIALILSIVALFNTFAVIMSVRKQEFNGLKVIGAKKNQIVKMTFIEVLIVTVTGVLIGLAVLAACVGAYSYATTGVFDWIVDTRIFIGVIILSSLLGLLAGLIPSFTTIGKLKRQFRVE